MALRAAFFAMSAILIATLPAQSQNVKVTPLGSHDGEFCPLDRAIVFEDPDGTRILYDVGRTVAGAEDPRLGEIDAVLAARADLRRLFAASSCQAGLI